jgi:formamidopyrimidine-DNA glycosylase
MPELPDVEGFRREFVRHAAGKQVRGVHADPTIVRNTTPQGLGRALHGRRFDDPRRHGKWLICPAEGPVLLFHFGMTGGFVWSGEEVHRHRHDRLRIELDDGELRYRNMRKLGGVWLVPEAGAVEDATGPLGPDAYEMSKKDFLLCFARRRGSIKALLMNQSFVAGLGNLTVDEALWQARIAPRRGVASLTDEESELLYRKIRRVLRDSMAVGLVPAKRTWLTGARGTPESKCPRCGSLLRRERVAGRTTYWCGSCQRYQSTR